MSMTAKELNRYGVRFATRPVFCYSDSNAMALTNSKECKATTSPVATDLNEKCKDKEPETNDGGAMEEKARSLMAHLNNAAGFALKFTMFGVISVTAEKLLNDTNSEWKK